MKILGISTFYHDSGACLVDAGHLVAEAQGEHFTRKKHDHPIYFRRGRLPTASKRLASGPGISELNLFY